MSDQTRTPGPEDTVAGAHSGPGTPATEIAVGDRVICWSHDGPAIYDGPAEFEGFESWQFGLSSGELPKIKCEPDRVAPAGVAIPERDDRVRAEKRPSGERPPAAAGYWKLTLPGVRGASWHKTKRDATKAGCRHLAILDWHAARAAQAANG